MSGKGIDSRLAEVQRRIAQLDNVMLKEGGQLEKVLKEIVALRTEQEALLIVKKVIIDVFARIVQRTPVDTGRARASWQFGIGVEPVGAVEAGEWQGKIPSLVAEATQKIIAAPATVWFIANHLDYIEQLEAGWSKQAPAGMVALTLREMSQHLQKAISL